MNPAIKTAINIVGSQKKLGAACEVSQQAVYELAYIKADSECNGMFVRAYRVYTDKAPSNV